MSGILKISDATGIAFHSVLLLALKKNVMSADAIAKLLNVSKNHLLKVLRRLTSEGILKSVAGPAGGYLLNKPAEKLFLLEIYEAIEGPIRLDNCFLHKKVCLLEKCLFGDFLTDINKQFYEFLTKNSVAYFITGLTPFF